MGDTSDYQSGTESTYCGQLYRRSHFSETLNCGKLLPGEYKQAPLLFGFIIFVLNHLFFVIGGIEMFGN